MRRSNPLELTLGSDTDSEDERLLNSIDFSSNRKPALRSNPGLNLNLTRSSSPELTSLPPSPKRPCNQSSAGGGARRPGTTASQAKKAAQARVKEQKKALAEAKRQEKERVREEKEAARQAKIAEKIRQTFSDAELRGTFRRNEMDVVVSKQLYADTSRNDVLSHVRALFPDQVVSSDMGIQNLVTWRRRNDIASSPLSSKNLEAGVSLIIFSGANYWDMMINNGNGRSLFERAEDILSKRKGEKIFFVIYGIESERRKKTSLAVQPGAKERIISMQAIQDSYTALYMKYGIRAHAFNKVTDAAKYIAELTDAVCDKPYYQEDDFLDATLRYRDSRKKISNRSIVVSMRDISGSQEIANVCDHDIDEDMEHIEYEDNNNGEGGQVLVPFVRSEGREDLGYMYLSLLAQIPRMSYETAKAIRDRYPTLYHLFVAYSCCPSLNEKHSLLADLRCEPNNRRIGPALSKSIATVLTSRDPSTAFRM